MIRAIVVAAALCATAAVAQAYPQFQLGKENTCTACHVAPAGGGLLDPLGMGQLTAEEISTWEGNPAFLHGAITLPDWLLVGGDLRGAAGVHNNGETSGALFPMQTELYAAARTGHITIYGTLGVAIPKDNKPSNAVLAREHWAMYRSSDGGEPGFYVRGGRFMPVYGLRYAEHVIYTRRFGGTPLYGETYGVGGGYLSPKLEVHVTGFIRDRLRKDFALERGDGAAVYAELRPGEMFAVGAEARYAKSPDEARVQGGVTGKLWLAGPQIQIGAEAQIVHQTFDVGPSRNQLVAYVLGSYQGIKGFNIDLGLGQFDEDMSIKHMARGCVDLNIHWFAHSHIELLLTNRFQMIGGTQGGDSSFYSLLQAHYRI